MHPPLVSPIVTLPSVDRLVGTSLSALQEFITRTCLLFLWSRWIVTVILCLCYLKDRWTEPNGFPVAMAFVKTTAVEENDLYFFLFRVAGSVN